MIYNKNQAVINEVNGNVLKWLMDQQIDDEYELALRALHSKTQCVKCGQPEVIMYFPKYHSNLTDGLCEDCCNSDEVAL